MTDPDLETRFNVLADQIRDALDERDRDMLFLQRELDATQRALAEVAKGKPGEVPQMEVSRDQLWTCECGSRLGVLDPENNVMRIRYKDHYVSICPGAGGWIEVACRNCGRIVRVKEE